MILKPRENERKWLILFRVLSVLAAILSIVVLATHVLALINPSYTPLNMIIVGNPS